MKKSGSIKDKKLKLRRLAKMYYCYLKMILRIPNCIGKKMGIPDLACNLMMPYSEAIEKESNCYVTYNLQPKVVEDMDSHLIYRGNSTEEFCIVMQGPLLYRDDFTLETVRYYGRVFPGVLVIISTWENELDDYIQKLRSEKNCVVILNKHPNKPGGGNVNYQCVSSRKGMLEAKKFDKKYVLKSRTDMRITMPGVLEMLYQYLKMYPISEEKNKKQKFRLILFGVYLFHPYQAGDFFCFGETNDLINYYNIDCELSAAPTVGANTMIDNKWTYRMLFESPQGENAINIHYFSKMNGKVECELEEWWKVISEYIIALPLSFLNPIWLKYDYNHELNYITMSYRRKFMGGSGEDNTIIDFSMWLDMLYCRFSLDASQYEFYLDEPMS